MKKIYYYPALIVFFLVVLMLVFIGLGCADASDFVPNTPAKVDKLADAIFWAEGGWSTKYLFGIKSINCEGYDECRRICENTIRKNIGRYRNQPKGNDGTKQWNNQSSYLMFFQSRYCPTTGNLSASEKELNGYWLKNVKWFLNNPKEI